MFGHSLSHVYVCKWGLILAGLLKDRAPTGHGSLPGSRHRRCCRPQVYPGKCRSSKRETDGHTGTITIEKGKDCGVFLSGILLLYNQPWRTHDRWGLHNKWHGNNRQLFAIQSLNGTPIWFGLGHKFAHGETGKDTGTAAGGKLSQRTIKALQCMFKKWK